MTRREEIISKKDALGMLLIRQVITNNGDIVYQAPDGSQAKNFFEAVDMANIWLECEFVKE